MVVSERSSLKKAYFSSPISNRIYSDKKNQMPTSTILK